MSEALPSHSIAGKVAYVPGGTGGLGQAIAEGLAEIGARVVVGGTDQAKVTRLAEALRANVSSATEALELALRQARSLTEAAFAATPSAVSELGLDAKPKRRAVRAEPAKLSPS